MCRTLLRLSRTRLDLVTPEHWYAFLVVITTAVIREPVPTTVAVVAEVRAFVCCSGLDLQAAANGTSGRIHVASTAIASDSAGWAAPASP